VNDISYCVTIQPIEYRYFKGHEKGAVIGLINYPRFLDKNSQHAIFAKQLAEKLMFSFKQCRVTIVTSKETIMLTNINEINSV